MRTESDARQRRHGNDEVGHLGTNAEDTVEGYPDPLARSPLTHSLTPLTSLHSLVPLGVTIVELRFARSKIFELKGPMIVASRP